MQVLGVEQPPQVGDALVGLRLVEQVGLVENNSDHRRMARKRHQVAAVHRSVGVLLRVKYPDHHVRKADHPV